MSEVVLSLEGGAFSYGERTIFSGLNLEVSKSEVVCILGANGCGKTTLLRCLNRALRLKQGTVRLSGRDVGTISVDEIARRIGFVFQEHAAPFPFSVLEVVRMGRAPHLGLLSTPSHRDTEIAEHALSVVGIVDLKDKPYTQISGGERQLVLIARTLAQEPAIILMDEPTSHLDFRNQTIVLQVVNRLAENGLAVLMTSHLPDHALLFSSRVALMKNGGFIAVGKPDEVMTEASLKDVYGIEVKMATIVEPGTGRSIKLIIPSRESRPVGGRS